MDSYSVLIDGVQTEVRVERAGSLVEVHADGRTYLVEVQEVRPQTWLFIWNGRCVEATVQRSGDDISAVAIGGFSIPIEVLDSRKALRRADHSGHDGVAIVRAPMPGKIVRVLVAEGAEVNANQGIAVMEAMKMQNEIKSPRRGTVRKLEVVEGAAVNAGDAIAVVE